MNSPASICRSQDCAASALLWSLAPSSAAEVFGGNRWLVCQGPCVRASVDAEADVVSWVIHQLLMFAD